MIKIEISRKKKSNSEKVGSIKEKENPTQSWSSWGRILGGVDRARLSHRLVWKRWVLGREASGVWATRWWVDRYGVSTRPPSRPHKLGRCILSRSIWLWVWVPLPKSTTSWPTLLQPLHRVTAFWKRKASPFLFDFFLSGSPWVWVRQLLRKQLSTSWTYINKLG